MFCVFAMRWRGSVWALNWDDLKVFLAVARSESISAAGRGLSIDPATVGRRISRLEASLSSALFIKSPQGYELTREGLGLLEHVENIEASVQSGVSRFEHDSEFGLSGIVRIGAPDGCANFALPLAVARILKEHPKLELQIISQPRLLSLSKREVDIAISVSQPTTGRLLVQKLCDYHLSLAASSTYLQKHPQMSDLEDLKAHKLIGYIPELIFDKELDYFSELGHEHSHYSSNSATVQLNMVRAGLGVGVIHDFCFAHHRDVQKVLEQTFKLKRSYYLLRHSDDRKVERLSIVAERLAYHLKLVIAELENGKIADF